jgi:hypothetical protein
MKSFLPLALAAALAACTASVYHPTKSGAEMQADIDQCTAQANRRYWMDPVAALYRSYDCLEARGYQRNQRDMAARVERALGERGPAPAKATEPCRVPCRR